MIRRYPGLAISDGVDGLTLSVGAPVAEAASMAAAEMVVTQSIATSL